MSIFPIKKDHEPVMPQAMPLPRRPVEKPPEVRMSESYARAIQEFQDVQATLQDMQKERDQFKVDLGVEQADNARLEGKIASLEEELKTYKERVIAVEAIFGDIAAIIIRVHESRPKEKDRPEISLERMEQEITAEAPLIVDPKESER